MTFTIPSRYCGPPHSANGGWFSGHLAQDLGYDGAATVRLSSPPPLDTPIALTSRNGGHEAIVGGRVIATITSAAQLDQTEIPAPVSYPRARSVEGDYAGLVDHPFPTCYSCGIDRDPAEALCLRPAPVAKDLYAAAWVPREVTTEAIWASLDCPSGWALGVGGRPMVLGTMTAEVLSLPESGEELTVISWAIESSGRKHRAGSALFHGTHLLAQARSIWIAVDPASVRPRER